MEKNDRERHVKGEIERVYEGESECNQGEQVTPLKLELFQSP